jgi:hypothetical protein
MDDDCFGKIKKIYGCFSIIGFGSSCLVKEQSFTDKHCTQWHMPFKQIYEQTMKSEIEVE